MRIVPERRAEKKKDKRERLRNWKTCHKLTLHKNVVEKKVNLPVHTYVLTSSLGRISMISFAPLESILVSAVAPPSNMVCIILRRERSTARRYSSLLYGDVSTMGEKGRVHSCECGRMLGSRGGRIERLEDKKLVPLPFMYL